MLTRMLRPRTITILLLALIIAAVSAAFASSITMPTAATAAEGSVDMDDFEITAVEYDINASTNPSTISEVTLTFGGTTLPAVGADIEVQFETNGTTYQCTWASPTATCDTTVGGATNVEDAAFLHVLAGDVTINVT
ncbi:MAG: hypothetical protein JXJ17_11970, partial [Anaerolineae bacterium]|nr:hypothetical protein [Anaerolineae bacterium]